MNRGSACTASAWPPINRYRVPVEVSTRKNSFQSSFRCKVSEPRLAELLNDREAFFRARFLEVLAVEAVGFFEVRDPYDALNGHLHPRSISWAGLKRCFNVRLNVKGTSLYSNAAWAVWGVARTEVAAGGGDELLTAFDKSDGTDATQVWAGNGTTGATNTAAILQMAVVQRRACDGEPTPRAAKSARSISTANGVAAVRDGVGAVRLDDGLDVVGGVGAGGVGDEVRQGVVLGAVVRGFVDGPDVLDAG